MKQLRSNINAPVGICPGCGEGKRDWGFYYHNLCTICHNKRRKKRAEENQKCKSPKFNVDIADGIVVTEDVHKRLRKRAVHALGHTTDYFCSPLVFIPIWFGAICIIGSIVHNLETETLQPVIVVGGLFIVGLVFHVLQGEWKKQVDIKIIELAHARKEEIEEQRRFYNSPEWRLVRERIIQEQGSICQECGEYIKDDFDVTVDHIKPRSKFPELALDASNLRVLCRRHNSKKGASYDESDAIPKIVN